MFKYLTLSTETASRYFRIALLNLIYCYSIFLITTLMVMGKSKKINKLKYLPEDHYTLIVVTEFPERLQ